jgi:hypothetical protein
MRSISARSCSRTTSRPSALWRSLKSVSFPTSGSGGSFAIGELRIDDAALPTPRPLDSRMCARRSAARACGRDRCSACAPTIAGTPSPSAVHSALTSPGPCFVVMARSVTGGARARHAEVLAQQLVQARLEVRVIVSAEEERAGRETPCAAPPPRGMLPALNTTKTAYLPPSPCAA